MGEKCNLNRKWIAFRSSKLLRTGVLQKHNKQAKYAVIRECYSDLNNFFVVNNFRTFNELMFFINFHEKNAVCSRGQTSLGPLFYGA